MSHHSNLNIYKITQSENNMAFLGYGNNSYHDEYTKLTLTINETWKLLLNRMDIIPSCIPFSANTLIGTVLLFHVLHARNCCALVK